MDGFYLLFCALIYLLWCLLAPWPVFPVFEPCTQCGHHNFFIAFLGTGLGVYQALHPHVRRITLRTYKPLTRSMRIVFASDLHFGTLWGRRYGQKLVSRINAEDPDLVILAVTLWTAVFPLSCARAVWMPCAASALLWAYIPSWAIMISWQVREAGTDLSGTNGHSVHCE